MTELLLKEISLFWSILTGIAGGIVGFIFGLLPYFFMNKKDKVATKNNEINKKIEESNAKAEQSINKGYNAYIRDAESSIYKIKNATEFFIGEDNILYIIYAYGNQEYTEQMDLIIYKL